MPDGTIGEIKIFVNEHLPVGWLPCDGRLLQMAQYNALFAILGNTYGGDGKTTFALPDLRGRMPMHWNDNFPLGSKGGEEAHALTLAEMPKHTHTVQAVATGTPDQPAPAMDLWAATTGAYAPTATGAMSAAAVQSMGSGQPHENRSPYLVLNLAICTQGIFPQRS